MAVTLKVIDVADFDLRQVQQNVADAVAALSEAKAPNVGVVRVSASGKLVGNEDVVLVDAPGVSLVLPGVKLLRRAVTVKAPPGAPVTIKAVDIGTSPTIDGATSVIVPAGGTLTIVSDGRNYVTL